MKWISVEYKLPEINEDVLYYFGSEMLVVGFQKTKGFFIMDDNMDLIDVTDEDAYWMPLPKPPKTTK